MVSGHLANNILIYWQVKKDSAKRFLTLIFDILRPLKGSIKREVFLATNRF